MKNQNPLASTPQPSNTKKRFTVSIVNTAPEDFKVACKILTEPAKSTPEKADSLPWLTLEAFGKMSLNNQQADTTNYVYINIKLTDLTDKVQTKTLEFCENLTVAELNTTEPVKVALAPGTTSPEGRLLSVYRLIEENEGSTSQLTYLVKVNTRGENK